MRIDFWALPGLVRRGIHHRDTNDRVARVPVVQYVPIVPDVKDIRKRFEPVLNDLNFLRKRHRVRREFVLDQILISMRKIRILSVVGARPNFMKMAPVLRELSKYADFECCLVHTGQHYDDSMSQVFFQDLSMPNPDFNLKVGSGSHAVQTAEIMRRFEEVCDSIKPNLVIVGGDVNSTLACSLTAAKLQIPVAHIESGLRSFDRSMPEEINRIVTDSVSDFLFTTEESGNQNLRREGVQRGENSFRWQYHDRLPRPLL